MSCSVLLVSSVISLLSVISLVSVISAAPQLSLTPLRVRLRSTGGFKVVKPFTPFHKFFPTVVQLDFHDVNKNLKQVRAGAPPPGGRRRKVVRLETQSVPFTVLDDMRRNLSQSEARQIIEKGSNFVQALR